ncbi:uncharacterized MobA-related protein [Longilinea arvoryzae]|uniref:Uncharacterized MobA-related protein n=1 Tax=Longilinea arvoryzae TaxID=360412 RepID=A0A0S7BK38_9CHLR|nr:nucleotidyltransferase family protein [Longilinea arvoryzae]GAP14696.1 uncharacterized MobA-related protein [Longilinea arvoryzae]
MKSTIGGIVLAAGRSTRMGTPKLFLPWRETTVFDSVLHLALVAGLDPILVVTGAYRERICERLSGYAEKVTEVYNPEFENFEMLYSLKLGIHKIINRCDAVMILLGDQPQVQQKIVEQIIQRFNEKRSEIIIPSFRMRRGHPILIRQDLFPSILTYSDNGNLREFLASFNDKIDYVPVDSNSILEDIDSPEDYERIKKKQNE